MSVINKILKSKVFVGFLISYVIVLLIPIAIGIIAHKETFKIVERDVREASLSSLKTCMVVLDKRLAEVERIAMQLTINPNVLSFARERNPYIDSTVPCKIKELQEEIAPFTFNNTFIGMLYIYFNKSDVTILANKSHLTLEQFYGDLFRYGDMNESEWRKKVLGVKHFKEYFPVALVHTCVNYDQKRWETQPMLMYIQSFPMENLDKGQIMILIPKSKLEELMKDIIHEQGGWAYIIDSKNNILAEFSAPDEDIDIVVSNAKGASGFFRQKVSGQDMMVVYTTSSYNGWRYIAVLPYRKVMERIQYIKQIIYVILVISLLAGVLGAFIMAYQSSKPIRNIIDVIRDMIGGNDFNNDQNEYAYLRRSIMKLFSNSRSMQESLNKQLNLLKETFVEKLLMGGFTDLNEIYSFLDQLGFKKFDGKIAVAVVRLESMNNCALQETGAIKVILKHAIENHLGSNIYYHDLDFDKMVVIFNVDKNKDQDEKIYVEEMLNNVWRDMIEFHGISAFFTIGILATDYLGIHQSFDEALEALDFISLHTGKRILWYTDIPRENRSYYYPINIETRLINYVKLGNWNEIDQILKRIYKENFVKRTLSTPMMKYLIYDMRSTILKVLDILAVEYGESVNNMKERICSCDVTASANEIFNIMLKMYEDICKMVMEKKKDKNDIMEKILDYIDMNYMNPQLSLTSVADQFNFAPAYLSQLFKEKTGENYSTYLEHIRIRKACDMLLRGMCVNEVASSVGYNSIYAFRKAFKRNIGTAPSEYKGAVRVVEQDIN